jgi:hypothetical protein
MLVNHSHPDAATLAPDFLDRVALEARERYQSDASLRRPVRHTAPPNDSPANTDARRTV